MSSPAPRVLPSLTGLRAVAAGIVFVRHAEYLYTDTSLAPYTLRLFQQGAVGVSFFYILSGFLLHPQRLRPHLGMATGHRRG